MNKLIIRILVAAILLTALAIPMTSCSQTKKLLRMDEPERAEYFYRATDSKMTYAQSGSFDQTMTMQANMSGVSYKQTTEATVTFIAEQDDFIYLEQSKTTVDAGGQGTIIYSDSGYIDGMMFSYNREGKDEAKLKSAITPEEYNQFLAKQNEDQPQIQVGKGYSETMTCVQNEDGTWTATYEGFTEEGMKPFLYMLKGVDYMVTADHSIADARLTLNADADLYPTSMKIEFVFEKNASSSAPLPVVTMENVYHGWNNTVLSEPYDLSKFTEIDDLRVVEDFSQSLFERSTAPSGSFTVKVVTKANGGGYSDTTTDKQKVTFSSDGGYRFTYEYEEEGYEYKLSYTDGDLYVKVYDEGGKKVHSESSDMTEAEAKATVSQLMDPEQVSDVDIVDVETLDAEKGIYRFTLGDAFKNAYDEDYEMSGLDMTHFMGYFDATIVDGVLMEYTYHIESSFKMEGQTVKTVVDMTITFGEAVQGGETV